MSRSHRIRSQSLRHSDHRHGMAYTEFFKGMAIGMMRVWKCAREVGRQMNDPHATVSRWWTRWRAGEGRGRRSSLLVASRSTIDTVVEASWFGRRFGMVDVVLWL